eukprot:9220667-Pyramimonas_sp.AAC.1
MQLSTRGARACHLQIRLRLVASPPNTAKMLEYTETVATANTSTRPSSSAPEVGSTKMSIGRSNQIA